MGNFFEDVFINPAKKVIEEVVVRPAKKIAAEIKREASWAVEQEKDWLKSDTFKVAAGMAGVAVAGPIVLQTVGGVLGTATKAIPTIMDILGKVSPPLGKKEEPVPPPLAPTATPAAITAASDSNIADQLIDLLRNLFGAPSEATPPFVQAGTAMGGVGVEAPTNWLLLGLVGVGAYLLLR